MIIDAHTHLWKRQNGTVNGRPVFDIGGGKSSLGGETRQMLPPYMTNGENTAEILVSNMDYAGVSGAVVTQELMDGNQNEYLLEAKRAFPDRLKICSFYDESGLPDIEGFDGIKICAGKLSEQNLLKHETVFALAEANNMFISIDLADGDKQTGAMRELIEQFPKLKIAIGHFGMVTRDGWREQIKLAQNENVFIECGGITWLFNDEFYPYPSAVRAICDAAELVGFEKLMWGSDYPRTMTAITYKMSLDFIEKSRQIEESDKKLFLGENAQNFYGFGELTVPEKIKNMAED
ncbi:MAG: amidohydrolase [Clostridiales bacterium]|nr:amidohydrolase [Clostridiales bacterium]